MASFLNCLLSFLENTRIEIIRQRISLGMALEILPYDKQAM
jgi:hypothetical protein